MVRESSLNSDVRRLFCTICARAGSKGVVNKNIREINGKPLISHTIEQAIEAGFLPNLVVTSDSPEVLTIAEAYNVPFIIRRPDDLSHDTADKLDAICHAIEIVEEKKGFKCDDIIDLDPTSPLRISVDIIAALEVFYNDGSENLITAAPSRRSPYFNLVEKGADGFVHLSKPPKKRVLRRQDSPTCYDMNASIYIWERDVLLNKKQIFGLKTSLYIMPEDRSIDIDSELDFNFVSYLMSRQKTK